jgi:ATP-binding cassette, subfamily B, bacterial
VAADVIFVVEGGRIVEHGSHAELLRNDGVYSKLFAEQLAERTVQGLGSTPSSG